MTSKRFSVSSFKQAKADGRPITMLTAYDYTTARLLDAAGIDCLLVGDSLGMTMLGYQDTLRVTMDEMIHHTKAVARAAERAMVIGDMPFMSYHVSVEEAVRNAGRFIQQGRAQAIKLEGGRQVIDKVKAICRAQIPVLGHLGLTPQSVNVMGGFKVQGKDIEAARQIMDDALLLQDAGVFGIILECVPAALAAKITAMVEIPTIGIGAGSDCDGQVLVIQDLLGLFKQLRPKFVKTYADLGSAVEKAVKDYIQEVQARAFPAQEHTFAMAPEVMQKLISSK